MQKESQKAAEKKNESITPDPPKPNNLLVYVSATCMISWMVFLLVVAIIANQ